MAFKQFELADIGTVTIYKRRGARSIRLTVDNAGKIKVSMPTWSPYAAGLNFVRSKRAWLETQLEKYQQLPLEHDGPVGKRHRLRFQIGSTTRPRSRIAKDGTIIVTHPPAVPWNDPAVQMVAHKAAIRALRREAEDFLPGQLKELAQLHDFSYQSVSVRQLKSRWGSCDQNRHITLNLYLMQLPLHLIDYVLLHELTHTKIMQHGPTFWQAMQQVNPDTPACRREIREYRAMLLS